MATKTFDIYSPEIVGTHIAYWVQHGKTHAQAIKIALDIARIEYRKVHPTGNFPRHLQGAGKFYKENPETGSDKKLASISSKVRNLYTSGIGVQSLLKSFSITPKQLDDILYGKYSPAARKTRLKKNPSRSSASDPSVAYKGYLIKKSGISGYIWIEKGGSHIGSGYESVDAAKKVIDLLGASCDPVRKNPNRRRAKIKIKSIKQMAGGTVNGWALHKEINDYMVWKHKTGVYQITKGNVPDSDAGYYDLNALLKLKGLSSSVYGKRVKKNPNKKVGTIEELATKAKKIILKAENAGIVVDDGNVVDLIADNTYETLIDIRTALVVAGLAPRFPKATSPNYWRKNPVRSLNEKPSLKKNPVRRRKIDPNKFYVWDIVNNKPSMIGKGYDLLYAANLKKAKEERKRMTALYVSKGSELLKDEPGFFKNPVRPLEKRRYFVEIRFSEKSRWSLLAAFNDKNKALEYAKAWHKKQPRNYVRIRT